MTMDKRKMERRKVSYYLPVTEPGSKRVLGVVMDISLNGFKLDTGEKIPVGTVKRFYIDLPDEFAPISARMFTGRSRWCHPDYYDPSSFTVGYEFLNVSQDNATFFERLYEDYGSAEDKDFNRSDYYWK